MKKRVILCVSGSIAIYKSCDLVRLFVKNNWDIDVVMTDNAMKLITPLTFSALTGRKTFTTMWDHTSYAMEHIGLKEGASVFVAAPATANLIAKFANGIADDLVSTTYLSVKCPVVVAPAMNPAMWAHPATQKNVKSLAERGVILCGPSSGTVACGDEGEGRMEEVEIIYGQARKACEN